MGCYSTKNGRITLLLIAASLIAVTPAAAATVPAGFDDQLVVTLGNPTALAFTPDGRMLIAVKGGALRVYKNGALLTTPAINRYTSVCGDNERGMLGVAVDPDFTTNHFIYVYYTFKKYDSCAVNSPISPVNRVSRYVLGDNDVANPASEIVLIDNIPSPNGLHNAGDLHFGKDGFLYISTGDGGCDFRGDSGCVLSNDSGRDLGGLSGKILRITREGAIPAGNPYTSSDSDRCNVIGSTAVNRKCQEIYAWGLRNPFRTAFDVNSPTTRFYINDVGEGKWEEIDLGAADADFGWNVREGHCAKDSYTDCGPPPSGMTNPIYDYTHTGGCKSITIGDFVPVGIWPQQYDGAYLFGDYVCGKIFQLVQATDGTFTASEFATGVVSPIASVFGPSGSGRAFYYITWANPFPNYEIRRIVYTGQANRAPTARISADPTAGDLPLTVDFDGTGSSDPDSDPLSYEWDFGDGSGTANGATTSHAYTTRGTYTAVLTVRDGRAGVGTSTVRIDAGNNPPSVNIDSPTPTQRFAVGEQVTLIGNATDPEDGPLGAGTLSWRVERHHDTHTHPYLPPTTGNDVPVTGPPPEDLEGATNSYLDIYLTATDSRGLSKTVMQTMDPKTVDLSFETVPTGFELEVAGSPITAPLTVTSWERWAFPIIAPNQKDDDEVPWRFDSWSDGGAQEHTIVTGASPATYTTTFKRVDYPRPGGATPLRVPLVPAYRACTSPNSTHASPLSSASCTSPALESTLLTTSRSGRGSGFVSLHVLVGDPATPADEADVAIASAVTDVRSRENGDYSGKVLLATDMRITDSANGSSGKVPATVTDLRFSLSIDCLPTPNSSVGSNCALKTTADTLLPGLAKEENRAIVSTFSLELRDAGPDGSIVAGSGTCPPTCGSGDEATFLRQGLFLP